MPFEPVFICLYALMAHRLPEEGKPEAGAGNELNISYPHKTHKSAKTHFCKCILF